MNYKTLTTLDNIYEATFIHNYHTNEGINCQIINEHISTLIPNLNGMMGAGIQILIDKKDFPKAIVLLEQWNKKEPLFCPNCKSHNIKYGISGKKRVNKVIFIILSVIFWTPFSFIKQTYYCNDCNSELP